MVQYILHIKFLTTVNIQYLSKLNRSLPISGCLIWHSNQHPPQRSDVSSHILQQQNPQFSSVYRSLVWSFHRHGQLVRFTFTVYLLMRKERHYCWSKTLISRFPVSLSHHTSSVKGTEVYGTKRQTWRGWGGSASHLLEITQVSAVSF